MIRPATIAFCAALLAAISMMLPQSTQASTIPTLTEGNHTLVAVEPLMASMDIQYTMNDGRLSVGDRAYIGPMVIDAGMHYAEPRAIAAFLNLQLTYPAGVITFAPPAPRAGGVAAAPDPETLLAIRARLLALLNAHRLATGLSQLSIDPLAESAAQAQAKDMETAGIMRHTDALGRSPYERFKSDGGFDDDGRAGSRRRPPRGDSQPGLPQGRHRRCDRRERTVSRGRFPRALTRYCHRIVHCHAFHSGMIPREGR
jgi:hypothetical protein